MRRTPLRPFAERLAATVAILLLATPVFARNDLAPTVLTDSATQTVIVSGPHHPHRPALNLIRTDWWLNGTIIGGVPGEPALVLAVDLPGWAALESAATASGTPLRVSILGRGRSTSMRGENGERVAVVLPRPLLDKLGTGDFAIVVIGKTRSFPILVPNAAIRTFLAGYDDAIAATKTVPHPTMPSPAAAAPPTPAPSPTSSPAPAPITRPPPPIVARPSGDPLPAAVTTISPTPILRPAPEPAPASASAQASASADTKDAATTFPIDTLGIVIEPTAFGAMLLSVPRDSKLAKLGVTDGDIITGVDDTPLKSLSGAEMAARIGAARVRTLNCMAAGDVAIR